MKKLTILKNGIVKDNAVLILLLGLCPALAVSTMASNAIGMGVATTFVIICSNIAISLMRKLIPSNLRIPCFIVIIAGFVALVEMIVEAYAFPLYMALGVFLPLIAVNCIVFARAEMFANRNGVMDSIVDAIGAGVGFTLALLIIASVREILGSGQWFGIDLPVLVDNHIPIFSIAPGGFIVLGILVATVNHISKGRVKKEFGCQGCSAAATCGKGALCK